MRYRWLLFLLAAGLICGGVALLLLALGSTWGSASHFFTYGSAGAGLALLGAGITVGSMTAGRRRAV